MTAGAAGATSLAENVKRMRLWLKIAAGSLLFLILAVVSVAGWLWQQRSDVAELGWPVAISSSESAERVTVTWLGITTLLFDDGETQILIDGTFSRPSLFDILSQRRIYSDVAGINAALAEFRIDRLAAIVPVHSHFDHAMDVGFVANRTAAVVLGSESTANIASGAGVPVSQYQILAGGETRQFGQFTIKLIESRHAPVGSGGSPMFPGSIDEPLEQPARIRQWREGGAWSVLIGHPKGTALVQGSGGFVEGALAAESADVVMLGVAGLASLGPKYVGEYWRETVVSTGATRVFPVHYEDFTRPFGEVMLFPDIVDKVEVTAAWIDELAADRRHPVSISTLPFGQPVAIYP
jgi:L-ascorbate metabolism protein UlaG (beta-lactamase superfamily)